MDEDIRKKLNDELETCSWDILEEFYKKDSVFLISEELDLVDAAIAMALDKAEDIKTWQEAGDFRHPDSYEVEKWRENPRKKMAKFLIIQPFVLIQKMIEQ